MVEKAYGIQIFYEDAFNQTLTKFKDESLLEYAYKEQERNPNKVASLLKNKEQ